MRFFRCCVRSIAFRPVALLLFASLAVAARAQMPSMPSTPSVPSVPTVPTVPTAPSAPSVPGADQVDAVKQDAAAAKKAKEAMKSQPTSFTGTTGEVLTKFMQDVTAAVNTAAANRKPAAMEAGRDLALAISSTQNVYDEDLKKPVAKGSNALKTTLDQLQAAIKQLKTMTPESVQVASTGAEQVSNSLPYREKEPKLNKFTPRFLVPSSDPYLVKMNFTGTFDFSTKPEFFPVLTVNGHTYKAVASTMVSAEFAVPITDILAPGTAGSALLAVPGTLKVPWQTSSMMGRKHSTRDDEFHLLLFGLPSGPGTVKFMSKSTRLAMGEPQRHTGQQFYQCSGRSCGKGDDINHVWTEPHGENCAIVPGSSTFDVSSSTGAYTKQFLGDGGDGVSYSVSTQRKGTGTSKVTFSISFMETCGKEVPNNVGDDVPLKWGETKTFNAAAGTWRVSMDAFDGTHGEFTQADSSNPLLKVAATPDAVTISAPSPASVVWPAPQ